MIQVFSKEWFKRYQNILLWFVNAPILKYYIRWTLGFAKGFYNVVLSELTPSSFTIKNKDNTYTLIAYSRQPFADALYKKYLWLWEAFHFWDINIANKYYPELNLSFDTLTAYPQSSSGGSNVTCDGSLMGVELTYSAARSNTPWNAPVLTGASGFIYNGYNTGNSYYYVGRVYLSFDTTSIAATKEVSSATLSVYTNNYSEPNSSHVNLSIYASTQANANTLTTSDFNSFGSTVFGTIDTNNTNKYKTAALTTSSIILGGITKYIIRADGDVNNTTPTGFNQVAIITTDNSTNKPYLTVVYGDKATNTQPQMII